MDRPCQVAQVKSMPVDPEAEMGGSRHNQRFLDAGVQRENPDTRTDARSGKKIAYILGTFPILTTTFIDRELLEAKRVGLDMVLVAIRKSKGGTFSAAVQQLSNETVYLLPVSPFRLISAHVYFFATRFPSYLGTLSYLLSRKHPSFRARFKTLLHFGEGVLATALLRKTSVEHVHAHFADRATVVAMVIHRLLEIPYSLTAHAVDIYFAPVFLSEKIKNAKFTATCTRYNKLHLEKETGHRVELIYHGLEFCDIPRCVPSQKNEGLPLILSVGQFTEQKGFPYLIRACGLLRDKGYNFTCEIIGDGAERPKLSALIKELNLVDIVVLRGALSNADVMREYPKATIFVLACIVVEDGNRDGIPNVILEAMAHGLPVISTDVSGVPEVVRDKETGWLTKSGSAQALSAAIASALDHPEDAAAIGQNALGFVREQFDIRRNIGRLIEMLME
jgi:glycosyltransferase involved in cell wall biosynthesis